MFAIPTSYHYGASPAMRRSPVHHFLNSDLSAQLVNEFCDRATRFAVAAGQAPQASVFNPKFDLRETEEAYELHGELPGLKRENANIEFSDWKTMVIKGRIEREYASGNSSAPASTASTSTPAASAVEDTAEDTNAPKKASVSDAEDEDWDEVNEKTASPEASEAPKAPVATTNNEQAQHPLAHLFSQSPVNRYRVSERSVGEFSRTFKFPSPIDQDGTTATLENGILSVTVPKSAKKDARRIAIN